MSQKSTRLLRSRTKDGGPGCAIEAGSASAIEARRIVAVTDLGTLREQWVYNLHVANNHTWQHVDGRASSGHSVGAQGSVHATVEVVGSASGAPR